MAEIAVVTRIIKVIWREEGLVFSVHRFFLERIHKYLFNLADLMPLNVQIKCVIGIWGLFCNFT